MKKVYSADKESEETRLRLWKPHDPASHAATLASSRFQQSGWTRTSQNLCLLYIWSILHSPWDDQWPESEVWKMIVNSPARAINNNLGSDFTSNSNRLHQSLAHCLCLGDESITTERDRVGLGSLWSGSLQRTQTQDLSQMELCVYSRERSSGGKMTQRRAYFVTRSDAANECHDEFTHFAHSWLHAQPVTIHTQT